MELLEKLELPQTGPVKVADGAGCGHFAARDNYMRVPPNPVNSQHTADNAVAAARAASNLSVALSALTRRPGADIRI